MGFIFGATIGGIILTIFVALFLFLYSKQNSLRKDIKKIGTSAEKKINNDLKIWAKHTNNKFIDASLYKYDENKVVEIDSIIISSEAMIVVEIKSINGGIRGGIDDHKWTKVLGDNTFKIGNPVTQNQKHIDHIMKMTKNKVPVISLIIFSNRTNFIDVKDIPSHVVIVKHAHVFDVLDKIKESLKLAIDPNKMKQLYSDIKSFQTTKSKDINLHKKITGEKQGSIWK
ncbi:nuclease-related domain-containing protein [Candidatus Mycoplasma mahonii]|uniref:nuclease-related domain-containing protein n=1 Tax=Candidatus Mycoplasma mahonii TaxID=3004105 RepID=UPI0026F03941|nr:nuclease-related domain-containing protein [Candidatus Mycoplasma mahonii]WKX02317.1 nuclease-related domain-containing protein [Candidatus Mycoplasma mahonii]